MASNISCSRGSKRYTATAMRNCSSIWAVRGRASLPTGRSTNCPERQATLPQKALNHQTPLMAMKKWQESHLHAQRRRGAPFEFLSQL